jgi:subtilase family serine protease
MAREHRGVQKTRWGVARMRLRRRFALAAAVALVAAALTASLRLARASSPNQGVIAGNRPDLAFTSAWERAPADRRLHMAAVMALRNTSELDALKGALQSPGSPHYHKWLSRAEFMRRFGPAPEDLKAVASWLEANHFQVLSSDARTIHFTGTVATAERTFSTTIVQRGSDYANLSDPRLPQAVADRLVAIFGLSRVGGAPAARFPQPQTPVISPQYTIGKKTHFSPQDFWTYYDESPPTMAGNNGGTGAGDCIGLLETADTVPAAVDAFTTQFGLPAVKLTVVPTDPSQPVQQPQENEPILDVDWAHAVAPNTPIVLYVANDPDSPQSHFDALSAAVNSDLCGAISSSIDNVGSACPGLAEVMAFAALDTQAVAQGQTLFHSSGDYGSFYPCGQPGETDGPTGVQPSVEESSASADVTVVGGTQFIPEYDSSGANTSVLAPGFEHVWNQFIPLNPVPTPTPIPQKGASGGGISAVFKKPQWQQDIVPFGLKQSEFTMRGVPDVAAVASPSEPGLWIATTNEIEGCPKSAPICYIGDGGTSASSPVWAGISRLIAKNLNNPRIGNINPRLYAIAAGSIASGALVDVSQLGENCTFSNCSVYPGYQVGPGYDLATGLGSPDINKLVAAFAAPTPTPTATPTGTPRPTPTSTPVFGAQAGSSNTTSAGALGQSLAAGTLTVRNTGALTETIGAVTFNVSEPALFNSLSLTARINGGAANTASSGSPASVMTFAFRPALLVPAGGSSVFTLAAKMTGNLQARGRGKVNVVLAGIVTVPGGGSSHGCGAMLVTLAVINFAWILLPGAKRRLTPVVVATLMLLAATQAGCGGSGNSAPTVLGSSQQSVPAGGVAVSNADGAVRVSGLPASVSTIVLIR